MIRNLSRYTRLLTIAALILGAGCEGDKNKIPGDTKANPVSPTFLFLDVRASRNTTTAGEIKNPIVITVQANFADTGAPVANGTVVALTTSLGSFDAPGGAAALDFEIFGGVGTATYYPPLTGDGGTARIRAELQGIIDTTSIFVRPEPGERPEPEPAPVASTVTIQASPTAASEAVVETQIQLLAIVRDSAGDPFGGAGVNFTTEAGTLFSGGSVLVSDSNGEVFDTLSVTGAELEGIAAGSFNVTATLGVVGGSTSSSFAVTILRADAPPVATSVTLDASPTAVQQDDGDGGAAEVVDLSAIVRDQFGAFFNGSDVQFSTQLGTLGSTLVTSAGSGQATTTLTLSEAEMAAFPSNTFTATATVGVPNGTTSADVTITIIRPSAAPLTAAFTFSADPSLSGDDVVEFTDTSTGGPTSWSWDLDGDNVADDAFIPNPVFDYGSLGQPSGTVIQVTLIVGNGITTSSTSHTITIQP